MTERGIEANPKKIKVILDMSPPKTVKEVQRLAGWVTTLNRFVSKSADKCAEFFRILKNPSNFQWTPTFQRLVTEVFKP